MPLGIGEERKCQPELLELGGRDDRLTAKRLGFLKVGRGVIDLDVEGDLSLAPVLSRTDPAADALVRRCDQP